VLRLLLGQLVLIETAHHCAQARSQTLQRSRDLADFVRPLELEGHAEFALADSVRMLDEIKGRPLYVVEEEINLDPDDEPRPATPGAPPCQP